MAKKIKTVPHTKVMKQLEKTLKNNTQRKVKVVNGDLEKNLIKIIDKEIIKHARTEALKILLKATKEEIGEFLYYYHSNSNVTPAVIDSVKDRLVKEGKMKFKKNDNFGLTCRPDWDDK